MSAANIQVFEITRFIGPLVLFGEGVILELSCKGMVFIGSYWCNTHRPISELERMCPLGGSIRLEATLETDGFEITRDQPIGIYTSNDRELWKALDVTMIGVLISIDRHNCRAILDCGIPFAVSWEAEWEDLVGESLVMKGDIRLFACDDCAEMIGC